ncbi:MAG: adenosylmethionine--8-amino-7-oxononanoate transaminase [Alphaproteobacteria bacterium]|nr:adenosylmethionine--8-amino-7-oxononanoate transaminase [Alphaproteobacteria bacterium]
MPENAAALPHLWLPYCQMQTAVMPQRVTRTEGCKIILEDGRTLIDGVSSWWSACHGYNHPHIVSEMQKQLQQMPHVMMGGLVHEPALRLARRLADITPEGLTRVFFSDSGSTAVEVALKMALQYQRLKHKPHKDRFLCFHDGYHGDTLGAMSVSDPERGMHKAFKNSVIKQFVVDIPSGEYSFAEFEDLLKSFAGSIAGLIIEPLVQGAGGMKFHSVDVLAEIHRLCKKYDVLFIADEIATGFYRTGSRFACDEAGIAPDILCLGKALTGGAIGMGATITSEEIFSAFLSDDKNDAFMHGPTFMGNALACAAANASLDLFEKEDYAARVEAIEAQLAEELSPCEGLPGVVDVRVKGAIGVVQMAPEIDVLALRSKFLEQNVWIRPFGDIVYLAPPLVITKEELSILTEAIKKVLSP